MKIAEVENVARSSTSPHDGTAGLTGIVVVNCSSAAPVRPAPRYPKESAR